jgi:hypothetical protein
LLAKRSDREYRVVSGCGLSNFTTASGKRRAALKNSPVNRIAARAMKNLRATVARFYFTLRNVDAASSADI